MRSSRRALGLVLTIVATTALSVVTAQPAAAACPPGTYPPSNCAPVLSLNAPTAKFTLSTARPSWTVKYSGASITGYQVRYNRAPWNGSWQGWVHPAAWTGIQSTSVTQTLPVGFTYCYQVRAIDSANRLGPWTSVRCTARPLDDRSLIISSAWTRGTSSNHYLGTYTRTTTRGARAYRGGAVVSRVAVVGTKCSNCGRVGVYVGSTLVATFNFASATTSYRNILSTGAFNVRVGATVSVRSLDSNRRVLIDGFGISRV